MITDKFASIPKTEEGLVDAKALTKSAVSLLPTVLMTLIIVATSFVSTLIQLNFSLKDVIWREVLIMIALRILLQVSSKYVSGDARVRRGMVRDPITTNKAKYEALSDKLDAKDFFAWVDDYNLRTKRKAYEDHMAYRITRLRDKISRVKYRSMRRGKVNKRLCDMEAELAELEEQASTAYIDENLMRLRVRIKPIRASDFFSDGKDGYHAHIYAVNPRKDLSGRIARGIPFTLFLSLLLALISGSYMTGKLNLMSVLADLLSIGINLYMGAFVAGDGTLAVVNGSYVNRQTILRLYFSERAAGTAQIA